MNYYAKCIMLFNLSIESVKFFKESELNYWIKRDYSLIDFRKKKNDISQCLILYYINHSY